MLPATSVTNLVGLAALCLQHLTVAPLTTRGEAIYWSKIAIVHILPALNAPVRGFPSGYCDKVWYGKTRMVWLPEVKIIEDAFSRFDRIHERDGQPDGQTDRQTHRTTA